MLPVLTRLRHLHAGRAHILGASVQDQRMNGVLARRLGQVMIQAGGQYAGIIPLQRVCGPPRVAQTIA